MKNPLENSLNEKNGKETTKRTENSFKKLNRMDCLLDLLWKLDHDCLNNDNVRW